MKTIIIGDIHGCFDEFKELLEKSNFDINNDKLILLGDYIDRGPKSFEVLSFLKELDDTMKERLILITGNHDLYFLDKSLINELLWLFSGKKPTINSFKRNMKRLDYFVSWMKDKYVIYYKDKNYQCAHASIKKDNIEDNTKYTLTTNRTYTKRNIYEGPLTITGHLGLMEPTHFKGKGKKEILEYNKEYELPKTGVICIDTRCSSGNKLTSMIIKDNKYVLQYIDRKKN